MNGIYLLLGSNMGNRLEYLREAIALLLRSKIEIIDESSIYETAPWGPKDQGWFLNVILEVASSKSPSELLATLLDIEQEIGRIRKEKWGERSIDIDILYYDAQVLETETLTIPHNGIPDRRFTLVPLVEMAPVAIHPVYNKSHVELLAECKDTLDCRLTDYKL